MERRTTTNHFLAVAVVSAALHATSAHALTPDRNSYQESQNTDRYTVSLPGSSRLPDQSPSRATTLGAEVGGGDLSLACDGVNMDSMFSSLSSDMEYIVDYYSNNTGDLILQGLIYTQPQLYSLLNSQIARFQAHAEQLMVGCQEARQWGQNNIQSEAVSECLEEGNSMSYCSDGEVLGEGIAEAAEEQLQELLDQVDLLEEEFDSSGDGSGDGLGDGSGDGSGGPGVDFEGDIFGDIEMPDLSRSALGDLNYLIANTYQMTPEAQEFFSETVTGLTINHDADDADFRSPRHGRKRVHTMVGDKMDEIRERLDDIVIAYAQEQDYSDLMDEFNTEPYAAAPGRYQIQHLAMMREGSRDALDEDVAVDAHVDALAGTRYAATVDRYARAAGMGYARVMTQEVKAGVLSARTDGESSDMMSGNEVIELYDNALEVLEAELALPEEIDRTHEEQKRILDMPVEFFED